MPNISCPIRYFWIHVRHGPQQIIDHLVTASLANLCNLLQLRFGLLVRVLLCLLVAAGLLQRTQLTGGMAWRERVGTHLFLVLLELLVLLLSVLLDLLLCFAFGVFYSLGSV